MSQQVFFPAQSSVCVIDISGTTWFVLVTHVVPKELLLFYIYNTNSNLNGMILLHNNVRQVHLSWNCSARIDVIQCRIRPGSICSNFDVIKDNLKKCGYR